MESILTTWPRLAAGLSLRQGAPSLPRQRRRRRNGPEIALEGRYRVPATHGSNRSQPARDDEGGAQSEEVAQVVSDTNAARPRTALMPIHPRYRWFYPIDWPQLSAVIRFRRAQGKCEGCRRPHGRMVCHLGDGRWWDRDGKLARRTRQTARAATPAVAVEGDCADDARGPGLLASRSRPNQQPALEPEGVLPALPHAARPAGASAPALVHAVPAQSARRPLPGSVSVAAGGERTAAASKT